MNIAKKYYMCGKFYAIVETDSGMVATFRLSSVQSLTTMREQMAKHGFDKDKWCQTNSTHINPISSFWTYNK
jgi:hypothetical protein